MYAGQILDGANMIAQYLVHLGFADMTEKKVFHWAADGRLPVKKIGNRIVANKRALLRHLRSKQRRVVAIRHPWVPISRHTKALPIPMTN